MGKNEQIERLRPKNFDGPDDLIEVGFPGGELARDLAQNNLLEGWKALAIKRGDKLQAIRAAYSEILRILDEKDCEQ